MVAAIGDAAEVEVKQGVFSLFGVYEGLGGLVKADGLAGGNLGVSGRR